MFTNRPAMKLCFPLILGIIIGRELSLDLQLVGILLILLVGLGASMLFSKLRSSISAFFIFFLLITFGVFKITYDGIYRSDDNISKFIPLSGNTRLQGTVSELPRQTEQSVRFVVDAESIVIGTQKYHTSGGVLVSFLKKDFDFSFIDSLSYGREVYLAGELMAINTVRNPGEFDLRHYLQSNGIYARFYPKDIEQSCFGAEAKNNLLNLLVFPVRKSIAARIDLMIGGEEAKFLKGLIIGERSEIPMEVKNAFINSGVMHILAVSGLHVVIVTFILLIIFQMLRIPEKIRLIITCVLLVYYIYLTGNSPSVARSVIMAIVFLFGKILERKNDIFNVLAFSAIILLLIDSEQLFQPGFQLSYVAVFAIIYLYPKLYGLKNLLPDILKDNRFIISVFSLLGVSVAAGLGTLPFTSIYFGKISLISFFANIIVVPLSNIILALGMIAVALSYLSLWLADIYAQATSLLTWILLNVVDRLGNLHFSYLDARFSTVHSLLFYAFLYLVINIDQRKLRIVSIIMILIGLNLWLYAFQIFNSPNSLLRITFLDVGQGDAVFIEFPNGRNMLIDGGPRTFSTNAGSRFITPFLKYRGITTINTIVISHFHDDHIGGIPFLLRQFKIGRVYDACSVTNSSISREYLMLIDSLRIPRGCLYAGMSIENYTDMRMYVLHPSGEYLSTKSKIHKGYNNQSVVIKILYGNTSLLLPGDAEEDAENYIGEHFGNFLKSDLLKLPHHGSATSTIPQFYSYISPKIAVISVGMKNKFGHPSPLILRRLIDTGCQYFRTDEKGAIIMESDGVKWSMVKWR